LRGNGTFELKVWLAASCLALAACSGKPADAAFDTTLSRQQVMKHVINPAALLLWARVEMNGADTGPAYLTPATEADWLAAENEAAIVAEGGNMLLLPGRAVLAGESDDWKKFARALTTKALAVKTATAARDGEKMFQAGADLYQACSDCHAKYYIPYLKPDGSFVPPS
jgi:cytochrome c556